MNNFAPGAKDHVYYGLVQIPLFRGFELSWTDGLLIHSNAREDGGN